MGIFFLGSLWVSRVRLICLMKQLIVYSTCVISVVRLASIARSENLSDATCESLAHSILVLH